MQTRFHEDLRYRPYRLIVGRSSGLGFPESPIMVLSNVDEIRDTLARIKAQYRESVESMMVDMRNEPRSILRMKEKMDHDRVKLEATDAILGSLAKVGELGVSLVLFGMNCVSISKVAAVFDIKSTKKGLSYSVSSIGSEELWSVDSATGVYFNLANQGYVKITPGAK